MTQSIPVSQIIDSSGIAERYNIGRNVVSNWKARTDFPAPLDTPLCHGYPIYDVAVIDAWMEAHTRPVTTRTLITTLTLQEGDR